MIRIYSLESLAIIWTYFFQGLLRISPYAKQYELDRFEDELTQELNQKAVQIATETVQAKMLEGLYENMEMMNADLEFQIELQKRLLRDQ